MIKIDHNANDDDSVNKLFKLSTITNIIEAKTRDQDKDNNMTTTRTGPFLSVYSHFKYEPFVAGLSGGVLSTLVLHPLDLMKIRFAVNDGRTKTAPQYPSLISAVRSILKTEGVKGLYRGVVTNVLGSGISWGFYFFFYESMKAWIQGGDPSKSLSPTLHLLAAADAGLLSLLITNPLWVVKTRLCLQYATDVHIPESKKYAGMNDAFRKIWRTEGIKGLYKGLVPGMIGVSHGAIQFMIYEDMKKRYNIYHDRPFNTKPELTENIGLAASSKFIAAASTYPYQVVRARLQDHHHDYRGTWHCVKSTFRGEGWRGFYKGLSVNVMRVVPATAICLTTFENVVHYLKNMDNDANNQ